MRLCLPLLPPSLSLSLSHSLPPALHCLSLPPHPCRTRRSCYTCAHAAASSASTASGVEAPPALCLCLCVCLCLPVTRVSLSLPVSVSLSPSLTHSLSPSLPPCVSISCPASSLSVSHCLSLARARSLFLRCGGTFLPLPGVTLPGDERIALCVLALAGGGCLSQVVLSQGYVYKMHLT